VEIDTNKNQENEIIFNYKWMLIENFIVKIIPHDNIDNFFIDNEIDNVKYFIELEYLMKFISDTDPAIKKISTPMNFLLVPKNNKNIPEVPFERITKKTVKTEYDTCMNGLDDGSIVVVDESIGSGQAIGTMTIKTSEEFSADKLTIEMNTANKIYKYFYDGTEAANEISLINVKWNTVKNTYFIIINGKPVASSIEEILKRYENR